MSSYNLSELFERVAAKAASSEALVTSSRRLTYAELDERATRLANALRALGIGRQDKVGLHLQNGNEYLEGMLAAFKLSAIPVNINYRYVERELEHLYNLTDLAAVIVHRQYAPRVSAIRERVETLRHVILVEDGSKTVVGDDGAAEPGSDMLDYEQVLSGAPATADFAGRSSDDLYIACTGGTTGMPKGVVWRQEDIFFATMGGGDPTTLEGPITSPEQLSDRVLDPGIVGLITPPLMHVSAHWAAFQMLLGGGKVVLPPAGSFDAKTVWSLIESERANVVTLVGDAMVRPLLDAFAGARDAGKPIDASSLLVLASGGALVSAATKERAKELLPNVAVVDGFGSTETGVTGTSSGTAFTMDERMAVLDDDLQPVVAGSGAVGRLARRGRIPLGYYNDPEKTAETFVEKDGVRWVLPGDLASVDEDGKVVLHGRGSTSINTGGEKVFPEEVESALLEHPSISDVLVVGVPDERWGHRVVAVAAVKPGEELNLLQLKDFARDRLAGYKLPRDLVTVPAITRNPNGKADYGWAREQAEAALG